MHILTSEPEDGTVNDAVKKQRSITQIHADEFFNNTGKRYLFIAASTDTVDSFELIPVVCP